MQVVDPVPEDDLGARFIPVDIEDRYVLLLALRVTSARADASQMSIIGLIDRGPRPLMGNAIRCSLNGCPDLIFAALVDTRRLSRIVSGREHLGLAAR